MNSFSYYEKILTRDILQREYAELFLSEREIAAKFNVPRQWVQKIRKKYGIQALDKSQRAATQFGKDFTRDQEDLIMGTILGDAGVYERPRRGGEPGPCYYKCGHGVKQRLLVEHLSLLLNTHGSKISIDNQKKNGRIYRQYVVTTAATYKWRPWRELFYAEEKRWLPEMLEKITPRVLAYWFAGDGSYEHDHRSERGDLKLCSEIFKDSAANSDALVELFRTWGLEWEHTVFPSLGLRTFILKRTSQEEFVILMKDLLPPGVLYKIPPYLRDLLNDEQRLVIDELRKIPFSRRTPTTEEVLRIKAIYRDVIGFPYPKPCQREISEEVQKVRLIPAHDLVRNGLVSHSRTAIDVVNSYHPNIWSGHSGDSCSPVELFNDDKNFTKVVRDRFRYGNGLYPRQLLVGLRQRSKCPANYPPATAKCLYDVLLSQKGHALDPCGGYGGRLLGAICSAQVLSHTVIEPSEETIRNSEVMLRELGSTKPITIIRDTAEEWMPAYREGYYDLIFTSPPYQDHEKYSEEEDQVSVRFGTPDLYREWICIVLRNWKKLLKPSGQLIIQVSNPVVSRNRRLPIVEVWRDEMRNLFTLLEPWSYDGPGGRGARVIETLLRAMQMTTQI